MMNALQEKITATIAVMKRAASEHPPVVFANSLSAEDMVLTDLIARHQPDIEMFSLDTGRLPKETYDLIAEVGKRYAIPLKVYFPDNELTEEYVAKYGINGFYGSVESRKACCFARKVEPLRRALKGKGAWITGMRRDQAVTRGTLEVSSFDADNGLQKFNPLLGWSHNDVWAYIREYDVPYNKLHDQFYPSIGCAPCTRSITVGEDIRAGRWWWENPENKECGLHVQSTLRSGQSPDVLRVSVKGNVGSEAHDVSRSQNLSKEAVALGKGNVGSEAHDVSRNQNPLEPVSHTSLQATRTRIHEISEQIRTTGKEVA